MSTDGAYPRAGDRTAASPHRGRDTASARRLVRPMVREVRRHWGQLGVPWPARRRGAEELEDHLVEVLRDGGHPDAVLGDDLATFAAEWARASQRRPVVRALLLLTAQLALAAGILALSSPFLDAWSGIDARGTGFTLGAGVFLAGFWLLADTRSLLRWFRGPLSPDDISTLEWIAFGVFTVIFVAALGLAASADRFIPIAAPVAWGLVATGAVLLAVDTWLTSTGRL